MNAAERDHTAVLGLGYTPMTDPFLSSKTSGYNGRGYKAIFEPEPELVPSVTTVLKALGNEALIQWSVDQTAAYYAANPEAVFNKSAEGAYYMGRYYHKKTPDFDSEEFDPRDWYKGVLNDAADQGTWIHSFIEATFLGTEEPTPMNRNHEQMAEAYLLWMMDNDVRVTCVESTVFGEGYAGTLDWFGSVNDGPVSLNDNKSSRKVHQSHMVQLGGLGAAHTMAVETDDLDLEGVSHTRTIDGEKVTKYFRPEPLPAFSGYGVLQVRPDDYDYQGNFVPAFCEYHVIPNEVIDESFNIFKGALTVIQAQRRLKEMTK